MRRATQVFRALPTLLLVFGCSSGNFAGTSQRAVNQSENANGGPNGTGTGPGSDGGPNGTGTGANSGQNPSGTGNPGTTIYIPVGGTHATGTTGACTSANTAVASCNNGVITGNEIGTTTITPSGGNGSGSPGTSGGPGANGGGSGSGGGGGPNGGAGSGSGPGGSGSGSPSVGGGSGTGPITVVVYNPADPPPGVGGNNGQGGGPGGGAACDPTNGATQAVVKSSNITASTITITYKIFRTDCTGTVLPLSATSIEFDIDAVVSSFQAIQYTVAPDATTAGGTTQNGSMNDQVGKDLFGDSGNDYAYWETDQPVSVTSSNNALDLTISTAFVQSLQTDGLHTYLAYGSAAPVQVVVPLNGAASTTGSTSGNGG